MVAEPDSFSSLFEGIFVAMNLGQNSTELHSKAADDAQLAHPVADRLLL